MKTVDQALAWMRDKDATNETGWQGWCLKASRTAWGLPGGWNEADDWWASCPAEYKRPWSDAPPAGAPIYWRIGEFGHVGLSDGKGKFYGTDLPTSDQIGLDDTDAPRRRWGATPVGWAVWLNGQVLPIEESDTVPNDPGTPSQGDEGMDYAEARSTTPQTVSDGSSWSWLNTQKEVRDSANIHYNDQSWTMANRRFEINPSFTVDAPRAARFAVRAVVLKGEEIVQAYPTASFKVGPGEQTTVAPVLVGYCPKDHKVRVQVRAYDDWFKIETYAIARAWV